MNLLLETRKNNRNILRTRKRLWISRKLAELQDKDFYVTKMKFASKGDKSTVVYNHAITIKGIPLAAYDYVVNGKPALNG